MEMVKHTPFLQRTKNIPLALCSTRKPDLEMITIAAGRDHGRRITRQNRPTPWRQPLNTLGSRRRTGSRLDTLLEMGGFCLTSAPIVSNLPGCRHRLMLPYLEGPQATMVSPFMSMGLLDPLFVATVPFLLIVPNRGVSANHLPTLETFRLMRHLDCRPSLEHGVQVMLDLLIHLLKGGLHSCMMSALV